MDDLDDLYQELILDHNARPRNFGSLNKATHCAHGVNPLCGDEITVALNIEDDTIVGVSFDGKGCAISRASASLMTESLKGLSRKDAEVLYGRFHALVTEAPHAQGDDEQAHDTQDSFGALGKLEALSGVKEFPMRVKCATLAWHTFSAALVDSGQTISTEAD